MDSSLPQDSSCGTSADEVENCDCKQGDALLKQSADADVSSEHIVPPDPLTIKCVAGSRGRRLLYPPFLMSKYRSKGQKRVDPHRVRSGDGSNYSPVTPDNPVSLSDTLSGKSIALTKIALLNTSSVPIFESRKSNLADTPLALVKSAGESENSHFSDASDCDIKPVDLLNSQLLVTPGMQSSLSPATEKSSAAETVKKPKVEREKTTNPSEQVSLELLRYHGQIELHSEHGGEFGKKKYISTKTTKIRPHECDICGAAFGRKWELKRHRWTHRPVIERPYKCDECGAMFSQTGNLQAHVWSHLGHKPFKCDECGVEFARKSDLKRHSNTHRRDKPFQCDLCGLWFAYLSNLKRHMRRHTLD